MNFILSLAQHILTSPDLTGIVLIGIVLIFGIPAIRTAWKGGK